MDIAFAPFMFQLDFSIGSDVYTAHLSQAEFTPTQPTASFTDIKGRVTNFGGKSGWVLNLAGAQDWETVNSLSSFLTAHDGEDIEVTLGVPGATWEATVVGAATAIGGTSGTPAQFSTALQVKGEPVKSPALATDTAWAIAITGTPTGGTYVLKFNGYSTAPLAYNAATSAVTAAINALSGVTGISGVTVSGTASSYTLTFPEAVTMVPTGSFTGGTDPAIAATGA